MPTRIGISGWRYASWRSKFYPDDLPQKDERLQTVFELLPRNGKDASKLASKHDDRIRARARLKTTAKRKIRHAIEVRHKSFEQPEFIDLLRRHRIALVVADTAGKWPSMEDVTADFVYVRLHGDKKIYESGYTDDALDAWADKVEAWRGGGQIEDARTASKKSPGRRASRDVYVYFDNDQKVHAPFDAMSVAKKVRHR